MTGDEINLGLLKVWREGIMQPLVQVHDSVLFQYPEEREDDVISTTLKMMEIKIPLANDRDFYVPLEAKVGWNWGEQDDEDNPEGLIKWKGGDDRIRPPLRRKQRLSILDT